MNKRRWIGLLIAVLVVGIIGSAVYRTVTMPKPPPQIVADTVYVVADSLCVPPNVRRNECEIILTFVAKRQVDTLMTWLGLDCESVN